MTTKKYFVERPRTIAELYCFLHTGERVSSGRIKNGRFSFPKGMIVEDTVSWVIDPSGSLMMANHLIMKDGSHLIVTSYRVGNDIETSLTAVLDPRLARKPIKTIFFN
jgi:hypothetical protein